MMTGSKESLKNFEIAESDALRPSARLPYAKFLLANLNEGIFTDRWSAFSKQRYAWEQSILQIFSPHRVLCGICQCADGLIVVYAVVGYQVMDFSCIYRETQFTVLLYLREIGTGVFANW